MIASLCLALAIQLEAGNQSFVTRMAVSSVIRNRGSNPCKVITEKKQFSWYKGGKLRPYKPKNEIDRKSYQLSLKAAQRRNLSLKYRYFNNKELGKRYATKAKPILLGSLLFY